MKPIKKNDPFIEIESQTEWRFECKTRGPDVNMGKDAKPKPTWTYVFYNNSGHKRFIPEQVMEQTFKRKEA